VTKRSTIPRPAPTPDGKLLKVGELAERTGKTNRALRFYEEMELLLPASRTQGGFRLYDPNAVVRIHWIDRLQELGFSLADIRDFLSALRDDDTGPAAMDRLRGFYAQKLIETRQSIARLQSLQAEVVDSLAYLHSCQSCAPATPRSACPACSTTVREGEAVPRLVAAVHESA
jgi:MerR family transcriptional regulator, copper efflux regulator